MVHLAILWAMLIFPLASLFFMDGGSLRRFLPAALFITVINTIVCQLSAYYEWWRLRTTLFAWSGENLDAPVVYGLFFAGTIWIMQLSYGRILRYLLVNAGMNALFSYGIIPLMDRLKVAIKGNLPLTGVFFLMFGSALLLYLFQLWYEHEDAEVYIRGGDWGRRRAR
ncbi:hypothetical protein [Gorillibacterium sp. sgz5001074]|uniref:hypothetical protein n=1 Tax=Gorillibacterium sp. sgz5001074 TaxID=3446695 RepID=UPI003F67B6C2